MQYNIYVNIFINIIKKIGYKKYTIKSGRFFLPDFSVQKKIKISIPVLYILKGAIICEKRFGML